MLGFNRWHLFKLLAVALSVMGIASLALSYFIPAPPSTVIFATAFKGSSFEYDGRRYREIFARSHVNLELRETAGAVENLKLLEDRNSGVQAAFMTGGVSDGRHAPGVLSLGLIYNNPFWIFYSSSEPLERLSQLKGKRIAVGPEGSGTRFAANKILGKGGIDSETATLLPIAGLAAVDALNDGRADAVWFNGEPDGPATQSLLRNPKVRLMSFPMAEAFTRNFPDIVRLVLPQGVLSIEPPIPPNDVTLIGTTNKVLIRSDLHPEIVYLLLQAMTEVHRGQGIFQNIGEFPNGADTEYPVAASAMDFYKNGPSFLQRHLPLWLSVHVQRAIAALLTGIAVAFPLFNYAPKLYRGLVEYRLGSIYRRLRAIEASLQKEITALDVSALEADLERLDREINNLGVPMQHSDLFFSTKAHLDDVRLRLASRLVHVRSQTEKATQGVSGKHGLKQS